jgi:hypothetical protein
MPKGGKPWLNGHPSAANGSAEIGVLGIISTPEATNRLGDKSHAEQELYSLKFFRGARMGVEERGPGEPKGVRFLAALG